MEKRFTKTMSEQEVANAVNHLQEYCEGSTESGLFWVAYGIYKGATMSEVEEVAYFINESNNIKVGDEEFFFGTEDEVRFVHTEYFEKEFYIDIWKEEVFKNKTLDGYDDWCEEEFLPQLIENTIDDAYLVLSCEGDVYYLSETI